MSAATGNGEAAALIAALASVADPARALGEKKYLKSSLDHLGVRVPAIRRIALGWSKNRAGLTREELLTVTADLWASPLHEARVAVAELLKGNCRLLRVEDFTFLETLLRESRTWALVDNLSTGACAKLAEKSEVAGAVLDRWAVDSNFWLRRAALLTLLPALRRGEGDFARFGRYADEMLGEREFFIRKAIGWVLRDTGRKRPELVAEWLTPRIGRASGLTVREAVKHLPPEVGSELLKLRRG